MTPLAQELTRPTYDTSGEDVVPLRLLPELQSEDRSDAVIDSSVLNDVEIGDRLPRRLLDRFVLVAMKQAVVQLVDDSVYVAEIPGFQGVLAYGDTEQEVCDELPNVLMGWLEMKISDRDGDIPPMAGINLNWIQ
jgi:predicted RNase H-like HicB family nuclease